MIAITLGKKLFKTTILENNIIQTTGSAGETIAAGVAFTLPGFMFLSIGENGVSVGASYFNYVTILVLAAFGGMLGTMMMIPLRRSLIVKEHENLPYPEGTACASVLQAGEKGGVFAATAFIGMGVAFVYALLQKVFHIIAELPAFITQQTNKFWPSATINGEITPEYLGVGYIIGPKISGVLVAGSILVWWAMIPLLSTLVDPVVIATQLTKVGYLVDLSTPGGQGNWDPGYAHICKPRTGHLLCLHKADRSRGCGSRWLHNSHENTANDHQLFQRKRCITERKRREWHPAN